MMIRSFESQIQECLPDLWRYAWSLTRSHDAADDLVQDCIERALRKRLLWMPGRPVKPWLTKMLLNIFRDQRRQIARRPTASLAIIGDVASGAASAEQRLEVDAVWQKMAALSDDQREALLAVVVGGLSYEEAADSLGIPKGTLMSRIARARGRLKAELGTDPQNRIRSVK